jgi:hypothetical protein
MIFHIIYVILAFRGSLHAGTHPNRKVIAEVARYMLNERNMLCYYFWTDDVPMASI